MVCVPCFIIPVLLYIWHRFFQPLMLRYWNPWEKKDAQGNIIKAGPEFPFECKGGSCAFTGSKNKSLAAGEPKPVDDKPTTHETAPQAAVTTAGGESDTKKDK